MDYFGGCVVETENIFCCDMNRCNNIYVENICTVFMLISVLLGWLALGFHLICFSSSEQVISIFELWNIAVQFIINYLKI